MMSVISDDELRALVDDLDQELHEAEAARASHWACNVWHQGLTAQRFLEHPDALKH